MIRPNDQQVRSVLQVSAGVAPSREGWWCFYTDPDGTLYSERQAEDIVRACLMLGVNVTPVFTSAAWLAAVSTLADLDARVRELERKISEVRS